MLSSQERYEAGRSPESGKRATERGRSFLIFLSFTIYLAMFQNHGQPDSVNGDADSIGQTSGFSKLLRSPLASVLVFASVACYLWTFARVVHGLGDEGLFLYPAERILLGQVPYKHFFSELAPGAMYLQALWFKVFGMSLWSARIPILLIMAGIGVEIFCLSRKWTHGWVALLPVLIYTVTAFSRWFVVSHHWYSLFFGLGALILVIRYLEGGGKSKLFWAGICTSLCGICMQSKGAFVLLALSVVLVSDFRRARKRGHAGSWSALGLFVLGVLLPAAGLLLYFYRSDALRELAYCTFTYLWRNYLPYSSYPLPATLWSQIHELFTDPTMLHIGRTFSTVLWSLLLPLGACAFVWRFRKFAGNSGNELLIAGACLLTGWGLMFSEMHRFDFTHILFGAPVLLILAIALLDAPPHGQVVRSRWLTGLLATLAAFYFANGSSLIWREARRNTAVYCRRGMFYQTPERARRYQSMISGIQSRAREGEQILCFPYSSMLYFLTATRNPTRFDYLLPARTTPQQFEEVSRLLLSEKAPRYVFSSWLEFHKSLPELFPRVPLGVLMYHPLENFLLDPRAHFRAIEQEDGFVVFEKNGEPAKPAPG